MAHNERSLQNFLFIQSLIHFTKWFPVILALRTMIFKSFLYQHVCHIYVIHLMYKSTNKK